MRFKHNLHMTRRLHKTIWCAMLAIAPPLHHFHFPADVHDQAYAESLKATPVEVVKKYLQAAHGRDHGTAYQYISSADRRVRDKQSYLRSQDNFTGFALDLAKRLAADLEVWVIREQRDSTRARLEIGYRLPTGDEISSQLHSWNSDKLNTLSKIEKADLITAWNKTRESGTMITMEGRETFALVLEQGSWKIFRDWRSHQPVAFKAAMPRSMPLAVQFLRNDYLVKLDEPFQVDFKVTNRTDRDLEVKVNHLFTPPEMGESIDMIACGSLAPLRLRPRESRDISSSYLLRGGHRFKTQITITYDFDFVAGAAKQERSHPSAKF